MGGWDGQECLISGTTRRGTCLGEKGSLPPPKDSSQAIEGFFASPRHFTLVEASGIEAWHSARERARSYLPEQLPGTVSSDKQDLVRGQATSPPTLLCFTGNLSTDRAYISPSMSLSPSKLACEHSSAIAIKARAPTWANISERRYTALRRV